ncbi:transmembrane protein, putative, partial [Bodo saltans]
VLIRAKGGWVLERSFNNNSDTKVNTTICRNGTNGTVAIAVAVSRSFGAVTTLNFVARCALERLNVTIVVITPQQSTAVVSTTKTSTAVAITTAAVFANDASTTVSLVLLSLLSCTSLAPDAGVSAYAMSSFYNDGAIAMVVGNIGIVVAVVSLHALPVAIVAKLQGATSYDTVKPSFIRFPAMSLRVADFFLPGTTYAGFLCSGQLLMVPLRLGSPV